jgi:hypothetical protein
MLEDNPEGVALDCEMLMNITPDGLASLAKVAKQMSESPFDGPPRTRSEDVRAHRDQPGAAQP